MYPDQTSAGTPTSLTEILTDFLSSPNKYRDATPASFSHILSTN